jgi:hypothetical protein
MSGESSDSVVADRCCCAHRSAARGHAGARGWSAIRCRGCIHLRLVGILSRRHRGPSLGMARLEEQHPFHRGLFSRHGNAWRCERDRRTDNQSRTAFRSGWRLASTGRRRTRRGWSASRADIQSLRLSGGVQSGPVSYPGFPRAFFTLSSAASADWLFTARPRLGLALDRWLFYVTGGLAVARPSAEVRRFRWRDRIRNSCPDAPRLRGRRRRRGRPGKQLERQGRISVR